MVLFSLNKITFVQDRIDAYTHHDIQNRLRLRNQKNAALILTDVAEVSRDRTRSVDSKNTQKLGFVNTLHSA